MIGVVIWSDRVDRKAVIWCEDHGNLAYLNNEGEMPEALPELEEGDIVKFRLQERQSIRLAHDVAVVETEGYTGLSGALKATADREPAAPVETNSNPRMGNVVRLPRRGIPMARTA
ncbi:hypothetical protein SAMN05421688_0478 [Poseidonocella pacifica]|uniref:Cold shock protein, CspA family n=1 Tax=Poseidonocella pacifica TaxID=871651 RepID=A0A1I0VAZ4_9RHOB|nr:hypothetical protein [Poseidonocella pacifica]SFA73564.1 hypothetical protein SAMN05421688_0478 [Poseidonocella pacifica]